MKLFSKLKDYNSDLEEVLDNKTFSANIKNLLLSMVYKIESSYKDYKEVKRVIRTKEECLQEIVDCIKLYCDNIKNVEPGTEQAKELEKNNVLALTNEKERSILCYPTELSLLYAISEITPKYFYIPNSFIFKETFQNILVNGFCLNNLEMLTSFNGWSWDINSNQNINYTNNLIYQNMLFILGDKFMTEWRNYSSPKKDFLDIFKKYVKSVTGTDEYFYKLCSVIYTVSTPEEHSKIENKLREFEKELKKMQNKEKFLDDCKKSKLKLTGLVEKIDLILNDENLLIKEFEKRNKKLDDDKKIANIKIFVGMLQRERESYLQEISNIAYLLTPVNFVKRKSELEQYDKIYKSKLSLEEKLIELEKEFLIFFNKKINKIKTREEIVNIIYELRYFKYVPLKKGKFIYEEEILNNAIEKIMKKAITCACKMGVLRIVSMNIALNFEIIKYALDTKIIELEEIRLSFEKKEDYIIIKVYDKEVFEKQGKKKVKPEKKLLEVKSKRLVRLFI